MDIFKGILIVHASLAIIGVFLFWVLLRREFRQNQTERQNLELQGA